MSSSIPGDTNPLTHSLLRLSLHGNPAFPLSSSDRSIRHNLSVLWCLTMKGNGSADYPMTLDSDDEAPIDIDDSDDEAPIDVDDSDDKAPIPIDDADNDHMVIGGSETDPKKRPSEHAAGEHTSKKPKDIAGEMAVPTDLVHPPIPNWYLSRQKHCIHTILNYPPHNENVVLSPFSLISCMAMLCRGATPGPARDELAHYCWPTAADATVCDDAAALPALSTFVSQLSKNPNVCKWANILMSDHVIIQDFKNDITAHFKAEAFTLDERDAANALVQEITTIQNFLDKPPTGTTLINAICFADTWKYKFQESTTPMTFKNPEGKSVTIDMMYQKNKLPVVQDDIMTAVRMPYHTTGLSAWFIKHNDDHSHNAAYMALEHFLNRVFAEDALVQQDHLVELRVPKFTMTHRMDIKKIFQNATHNKITQVCKAGHLTKMSSDSSEFVGEFIQECILKVDQDGTIASAASKMGATRGSRAPVIPTISFAHTFYMVILHGDTILFVAKVASPPPSQDQTGGVPPPDSTIVVTKPADVQKIVSGKIEVVTKQHENIDDKEGEEVGKEKYKDIVDAKTGILTQRTYTVDADHLIRVTVKMNPGYTTSTIHSIQPVYIHENGEEDVEELQELMDGESYELPFPIEKEEGEKEEGWDLRDKAGNTLLKLRFTL